MISPWLCLSSCPTCLTLMQHAGAFGVSPALGTFGEHNKDSPAARAPAGAQLSGAKPQKGCFSDLCGALQAAWGQGTERSKEGKLSSQTWANIYLFKEFIVKKLIFSIFTRCSWAPMDVARTALVPLLQEQSAMLSW